VTACSYESPCPAREAKHARAHDYPLPLWTATLPPVFLHTRLLLHSWCRGPASNQLLACAFLIIYGTRLRPSLPSGPDAGMADQGHGREPNGCWHLAGHLQGRRDGRRARALFASNSWWWREPRPPIP
jgi:hypothetical protein